MKSNFQPLKRNYKERSGSFFILKYFFSSSYGTLFGGRMINLKQYDLLQVEQLGYGTATIHPSHHHTFFEGFYMSQ